MKRKNKEKILKKSVSMAPVLLGFALERADFEGHNSLSSYVADRVRRHMDEIDNFSRLPNPDSNYSAENRAKKLLAMAAEQVKLSGEAGGTKGPKDRRRPGTS